MWENYRALASWADAQGLGLRAFPLEGTYLGWVDFRSLGLGADALERLMKDGALLWLDEGKLFGEQGAGFERFNLACPTRVLASALDRLEGALRGLGKEGI